MPPNAPHAPATSPTQFSTPLRNAILALGYSKPGWHVWTDVDDDGDEAAFIADAIGDLDVIATVQTCRGSRVEFKDVAFNLLGTFETPDDLGEAVRAFVDAFDREAEPARREDAWRTALADAGVAISPTL